METFPQEPTDNLIELDPILVQKTFYPGLILLEYLREIQTAPRNKHADRPLQLSPNLEEQFHEFVCKVALICQDKPHGGSVSSCVVLEHEGDALYVFASNDKSIPKLEETKIHLVSLLEMFRTIPEEKTAVDELRRRALHKIISIQICRIRSYLRSLVEHLPKCIRSCQNNTDLDDPSLSDYLATLLEQARRTLNRIEKNIDLSSSNINIVGNFISSLKSFTEEKIQLMIPRLAREEKHMNNDDWYEIGHVIARLLAYQVAVDTFLVARGIWEELFTSFRVDYIPSSKPMTRPLKKSPWTAEQIVQKVALKPPLREQLLRVIGTLDKFQLDANIAMKWRDASFCPIVHCEILLLSWLERTEGGTHPERFFGRYKFIGTSKPLCRLCSLYVDEHGTDVKFQRSHRNLYLNWRVPDVWSSQGEDAPLRRKVLLQDMRGKICEEILRTMNDRTAEGRPHDSTSGAKFTPPRAERHTDLENAQMAASSMSLSNYTPRAPALTPVMEESRSSSPSNWSVGGIRDADELQFSDRPYERDVTTPESSDEEDVVLFKGRRPQLSARSSTSSA